MLVFFIMINKTSKPQQLYLTIQIHTNYNNKQEFLSP